MAEPKPFLVFGSPEITNHSTSGFQPKSPRTYNAKEQESRIEPKFSLLLEAFEHKRVRVSEGGFSEADPSLVLVLELTGSIQDFHESVRKIKGFEFLSETDIHYDDEESEESIHYPINHGSSIAAMHGIQPTSGYYRLVML